MKNSGTGLYNPFFHHIYIEKEIREHPVTERIISHFPDAVLIEINHYKDVFCRSRQSLREQKQAPALILARRQGNPVYEGAPVCQSFGNSHFYYTSSVMNCIYDCEYCYLQGMYPSANLVVFVNLEEIFEEVRLLLEKHPVYLCISYDTDLLAMEHILGYVKEWMEFADGQPQLTLEVRTKSADQSLLQRWKPLSNVILAWTLSPEQVISMYEHHTPSLTKRLKCICMAAELGYQVRICFDPLLYFRGWEDEYQAMLSQVFQALSPQQIKDVGIGVFRISQDYLKRMRNQAGESALAQFPYVNDNGVYHYGEELTNRLLNFMYERVAAKIGCEKVFLWEQTGYHHTNEVKHDTIGIL